MLEYFIIIAILLVLTIPIIALFFSEYNSIVRETNSYHSIRWLLDLDNDIRNIKYQGNGSYIVKNYPYPIALDSISIQYQGMNTIISYNITNLGQITFIYPFKIIINDTRWRGRLTLNITNSNGDIAINRID